MNTRYNAKLTMIILINIFSLLVSISFESTIVLLLSGINIVIGVWGKDKEKIATAFVTICTTDVTDFARVIYGIEDDQKAVVPVVLSYFMDKGWIIENRYDFAKAASINLFDDIIGKAMEEKSSNNANADTIAVDEVVVVEEVADSITIGY